MEHVAFGFVLFLAAMVLAEAPATQPAGISVGGTGITAITLTAPDLAALPHHTLNVKDHDGKPAVYEGVLVRDVLLKAGVTIGDKRLKGPLLGQAVMITSADGFKVTFGLAEFDSDYAERDILLADDRYGGPSVRKRAHSV